MFRYNSELLTHAYTHSQVHTCMLTYTRKRKETTQFYTVNNAMYPWHNQKDSAKAIAWSVFSGYQCTYPPCTRNMQYIENEDAHYLDLREPRNTTNLIIWYRDVKRGFKFLCYHTTSLVLGIPQSEYDCPHHPAISLEVCILNELVLGFASSSRFRGNTWTALSSLGLQPGFFFPFHQTGL